VEYSSTTSMLLVLRREGFYKKFSLMSAGTERLEFCVSLSKDDLVLLRIISLSRSRSLETQRTSGAEIQGYGSLKIPRPEVMQDQIR
jgi:hypothetical protein